MQIADWKCKGISWNYVLWAMCNIEGKLQNSRSYSLHSHIRAYDITSYGLGENLNKERSCRYMSTISCVDIFIYVWIWWRHWVNPKEYGWFEFESNSWFTIKYVHWSFWSIEIEHELYDDKRCSRVLNVCSILERWLT